MTKRDQTFKGDKSRERERERERLINDLKKEIDK